MYFVGDSVSIKFNLSKTDKVIDIASLFITVIDPEGIKTVITDYTYTAPTPTNKGLIETSLTLNKEDRYQIALNKGAIDNYTIVEHRDFNAYIPKTSLIITSNKWVKDNTTTFLSATDLVTTLGFSKVYGADYDKNIKRLYLTGGEGSTHNSSFAHLAYTDDFINWTIKINVTSNTTGWATAGKHIRVGKNGVLLAVDWGAEAGVSFDNGNTWQKVNTSVLDSGTNPTSFIYSKTFDCFILSNNLGTFYTNSDYTEFLTLGTTGSYTNSYGIVDTGVSVIIPSSVAIREITGDITNAQWQGVDAIFPITITGGNFYATTMIGNSIAITAFYSDGINSLGGILIKNREDILKNDWELKPFNNTGLDGKNPYYYCQHLSEENKTLVQNVQSELYESSDLIGWSPVTDTTLLQLPPIRDYTNVDPFRNVIVGDGGVRLNV